VRYSIRDKDSGLFSEHRTGAVWNVVTEAPFSASFQILLSKQAEVFRTAVEECYIINAGDDCYVHFALLFNAIVVHVNLPDNFLYSTIIA